jgi:peptidoglycan hydrolase-like amidase
MSNLTSRTVTESKFQILKLFVFGILVIGILFVICNLSFGISRVSAQECPATDYDCQIAQIQRDINAISPAQEKNKLDLAALNKQLADLNSKITKLTSQLKVLENQILGREEDLAFTKEIFDEKAKEHYTFLRLYDPITPFLFADSASQAFQEISLRQRAAEADRKTMEQYATDLSTLNSDKDNLTKNKASLSSLQSQVADKQKFLAGEVAKVDTYLSSLSSKQQELQALKEGGFSTTVGDVPASVEPCSGKPGSSNFCDPGFRPAFAAFSYGAPHRKGMSQYGAYGRARSGQDVETILHAYYGGIEIKKDYSTGINITVQGYGTVDIETYVKRIYEMPASWTDHDSAALKAQAVAARSYALAYTNNGSKSICATESCQVYKPANKGGAWDSAVDATKGWVLVSGGAPFSAWYASTAGGYTFSYSAQGYTTPNLWDTPGGQGGWPNSAYEITGGSPWFYKGWFKSRSGVSCGRSNPWLTSTEMADILNARYVLDGNGDTGRVSPVGDCWGGNPYSVPDLQEIGGYNSVTGVSVVYGNDGSTLSVTFSTNKGSVNLTGAKFKEAFNLRAPGYIGLKSSLFNIEKL